MLLRIAEPKAEEMRKEQIGGMPPLDRYKAEGNEHFKASRFTQAIQSVFFAFILYLIRSTQRLSRALAKTLP